MVCKDRKLIAQQGLLFLQNTKMTVWHKARSSLINGCQVPD